MRNWKHGTCLQNRYSYMVRTLRNTKSPPIVATEGGYGINAAEITANAAAFVLCVLDIRSGESFRSGQWQYRPAIPLLVRFCLLPRMQGAHDTNIAHSELMAVIIQEETLPASLPHTVVMDSTVACDTTLHVRNVMSHRTAH